MIYFDVDTLGRDLSRAGRSTPLATVAVKTGEVVSRALTLADPRHWTDAAPLGAAEESTETRVRATSFDELSPSEKKRVKRLLGAVIRDIDDGSFRRSTVVLAEQPGHIVGAACYRPQQYGDEAVGYLASMAVEEQQRRRGIGRILLQGVEEHMKNEGYPAVYLIAISPAMEGLCADANYMQGGAGVYSKGLDA